MKTASLSHMLRSMIEPRTNCQSVFNSFSIHVENFLQKPTQDSVELGLSSLGFLVRALGLPRAYLPVRQEQMLGAIEHPTVPLPSAQLMFAHQLSVVATSLRVACHSPARNIRISQLYRDHSARQDQLNRQNRQDDLSITTSVYL